MNTDIPIAHIATTRIGDAEEGKGMFVDVGLDVYANRVNFGVYHSGELQFTIPLDWEHAQRLADELEIKARVLRRLAKP